MSHSDLLGRAPSDVDVWTAEALDALGVRTDLPTAASVLGLGRSTAYAMAARGDFPVRVIRLSARRYVVPVAEIKQLLGLGGGEAP